MPSGIERVFDRRETRRARAGGHTRASSGVRSRPSPCSPVSVPPSDAVSATTASRMRVDALAPVAAPDVDERIHVDVRVAGMPEDHAARIVRGENLAERRGRMPGAALGGTAQSSMNCIDRRFGSSRARIGLAAWRSSHSSVSVGRSRAIRTVVAPASRKIRSIARAAAAAASASAPSTSASSADSRLGRHRTRRAARRRDIEKCAIEQLARDRARRSRAATAARDRVLDRSRTRRAHCSSHAAAGARSSSSSTKNASVPSLPTSRSTSSRDLSECPRGRSPTNP